MPSPSFEPGRTPRAQLDMLRAMDEHLEAVVALQAGRGVAGLQAVLHDAPARLEPMFPGATDAEGCRWYLLRPGAHCTRQQLDALVQRLQRCADVDAAYLKPRGEPPPAG